MKQVEFIDERGRKYNMLIPPDMDESDAYMGISQGPPDVVDNLDLPEPIATRVHNQLYDRGLLTYNEAQKRPQELRAAIQSALKLDGETLLNAFRTANAPLETLEVNHG